MASDVSAYTMCCVCLCLFISIYTLNLILDLFFTSVQQSGGISSSSEFKTHQVFHMESHFLCGKKDLRA